MLHIRNKDYLLAGEAPIAAIFTIWSVITSGSIENLYKLLKEDPEFDSISGDPGWILDSKKVPWSADWPSWVDFYCSVDADEVSIGSANSEVYLSKNELYAYIYKMLGSALWYKEIENIMVIEELLNLVSVEDKAL